MNKTVALGILCCLCAALPLAAQTAAPEGMVSVPAGQFWMGRAHANNLDSLDLVPRAKMDDRPANHIYLDAFFMDKYEVANADYAKFLQATGGRPPWHWPEGKIPQGAERLPVNNVNWFEASAYCKWAGKRLPTEAEWEKAARGGMDRNIYPWPKDAEGGPRAQAIIGGRERPSPVGSLAPNGYGLYDMIGNVMEWTNDWYYANYYPLMPKRNPKGPETGQYRSVRGAGWADGANGDEITTYYRNFSDPELRTTTIGFRCAK